MVTGFSFFHTAVIIWMVIFQKHFSLLPLVGAVQVKGMYEVCDFLSRRYEKIVPESALRQHFLTVATCFQYNQKIKSQNCYPKLCENSSHLAYNQTFKLDQFLMKNHTNATNVT